MEFRVDCDISGDLLLRCVGNLSCSGDKPQSGCLCGKQDVLLECCDNADRG